ncbi:MAG: hypothetical protein AAGA68_02700 [Pseudomonadota bacterium]
MDPELDVPRGVFIVGLMLPVAVGTATLGWWATAAFGFLAGILLAGRRRLFVPAMLAGAFAWGFLLVVAAFGMGEGARLASAAGAVMGITGPLFMALTVAFAGLITGCAAVAGRLLRAPLSQFGGA